MWRVRIIRSVFFLLLTIVACAKTPKWVPSVEPWQMPREDFRPYVKTVGVADVYIPDGLQDPEPIRQNFRDLIEDRLRAAGLTVIHPQNYHAVWNRIRVELGGFEDGSLDGRDHRMIAAAMVQTLEELEAGFDLDAILIPSIVVVEAPFAGGRAVWHGTTQPVKTGGIAKGFWAGSPEGTLGALSLSVTIANANGKIAYENLGGIEVLSKLAGKDFVLVPRAELFTDQARIEKSARLALDPFLKQ
ncbi:MAG: hypothetical protein OEN01_00980 [Candidatus Krumholzibacteria bacterium]|nr:hypothetical protein [Candidatus Krumholzibacteria bacterium]